MALLVAERSSSLLESPVVQIGLLGGGAAALWYWYNESVKDRCIAGIGGVGGDVVDQACKVGKKVLIHYHISLEACTKTKTHTSPYSLYGNKIVYNITY